MWQQKLSGVKLELVVFEIHYNDEIEETTIASKFNRKTCEFMKASLRTMIRAKT